MLKRFLPWLDERLSLPQFFRDFLQTPGQENRWIAATGFTVVVLFLVQFITGIVVSCYYVPSTPHAHISVVYLMKEVPAGKLIRSFHHQNATALVIFTLAYLLQLFYHAAYKQQRELQWVRAVVLVVLVLAGCFTGQLLPWDQKGYYGAQVAASVTTEVPILGEYLKLLLLGDNDITTLTLSRFFALHTMVLPVIMLFALATAFWIKPRKVTTSASQPYYPEQFAYSVFCSAAIFFVVLLVAAIWGSPLEPRVNLSDTTYLARPEWYFLPLFQLLKFIPAGWEGIVAMTVTNLAVIGLLLIPWLDRQESKALAQRWLPTAVIGSLGLGAGLLAGIAVLEDRNPVIRTQLGRQEEIAQALLSSTFRPIPLGRATAVASIPATPAAAADQPPVVKTFVGLCAPCHGPQGTGGSLGPSLIGVVGKRNYKKAELINLLAQPTSHGLSANMPAFSQLSLAQREQLADLVSSLDSPEKMQQFGGNASKSSKAGTTVAPAVFLKNCAGCHGEQGSGGFGPRLIGIKAKRSQEEIVKLIADPKSAGLSAAMPPFKALSETDRQAIAAWLHSLESGGE
jgi:ubiquinol-cytochrome c reductase cytochrome b subunit